LRFPIKGWFNSMFEIHLLLLGVLNPSKAFACAVAWDEWVTRGHDGGVRGTRRGRDALIPDTMPIIAFGHWLR